MSDSDVTVTDQGSGVDVRGFLRSVGGSNKFLQTLVGMRGSIPSYLNLSLQHSGTNNLTLPSSWTAKKDEQTGTTTSATQKNLATILFVRSDSDGISNIIEGSVAAGTTILNQARFFQAETFYENLIIKGTVKFYINVNVKSSGATACTLTGVTVKLRAMTATDTYVDITDAVSLTFASAISNATTAYVAANAKTAFIFAEAASTAWVSANYTLSSSQRLVIEITLSGTVGASMTATACINVDAGGMVSFYQIPIEEVL